MAQWELSTERLRIVPMRVQDAESWHHCRAAAPFDPLRRSILETVEAVEDMVRRPSVDSPGWQQFSVLDQAGRFVGDLGIRFSDAELRQCELGFAIVPALRGQGLASEATDAMVKALFRAGRRRIAAVTDERNRPAQRVLERLWFRLEGRFVQSWRDGEDWFDELAYARLVHD